MRWHGAECRATSSYASESMNSCIRQSTIDDFEGVSQVLLEAVRFHRELLPDRFWVPDPIMTMNWFQEVLENGKKALFVAAVDGQIAGVILLEIMMAEDGPILLPRRYGYVSELAVLQAYQGRGIGKALMQQAKQWSLEQGVNELELQVWEDNHRAVALYEKLGYQTIRRTMKIQVCEL